MFTLIAFTLLLSSVILTSARRGWSYRTPTSPTVAPVPTVAPLVCEIGDYEYTVLQQFSAWTSTRNTNCPSGWYCGALEYDIKYNITGRNLYGLSSYDYFDSGQTVVDDQYCADAAGCALYANGTTGSSCKTARWQYEYWQPTTCNADEDYNALSVDYDIFASFHCCDSDECNKDYVFDCTEDNTLSGYITDLYDCWNNYKRDFMTDIWCDDELYDYYVLQRECCDRGSCCSYRSRRYRRCRWSWRCSDDLRNIIEQFGQCACQAASDNNFDGSLISELVKNEWAVLCPNVDVTCNPPTALPTVNPTIQNSLDIYWWYVEYKFALRSGNDQNAADLQALILETIANRTGLQTDGNSDDSSDSTDPTLITTPDPGGGPIDRRRRMSGNKKIKKAFSKARSPIKVTIKALSQEKRRRLQENDPTIDCSGTLEDTTEVLGCDDQYTDVGILLELQSAEDSDFVTEVIAEEMDQAIEDATDGTIYDSVVTTSQTTTHVILDPDTGNEVAYDDFGNTVPLNETVEYDNYDDEAGNSDKKSNANIISFTFISILCYIVSVVLLC